jgi:glutamate racemase
MFHVFSLLTALLTTRHAPYHKLPPRQRSNSVFIRIFGICAVNLRDKVPYGAYEALCLTADSKKHKKWAIVFIMREIRENRLSMEKEYTRIGVFDSGIGGLTVLKGLLDLLPGIDIAYLGDSARLPYGTKSRKTIIRYSLQCAGFLVSKDIDMMVVACNTASAHAIPALREEFDIPVVGVVDAGARAVVEAGGARVGVIGTPSTINSRAYDSAIRTMKPDTEVFSQACPLFVPLVEEGWFDNEITEQVARRYLNNLIEQDIDTLLLGCTHYPMLAGIIAQVMGDGVRIVDSAHSTAKVVSRMIGDGYDPGRPRSIIYYLSDLSQHFIDLGEVFLGKEMKYVYDVDLCV